MKQGTKMIYDAIDNLQASPKVVELSEKIAELDEAVMQRMERDRKEIERLIRSVKAWEEKTKVYEESLEAACGEVEILSCKNPCEKYDIDPGIGNYEHCDNDCGVCLKNYFLAKGQDRLDMQKACADEEEGRKRMDERDVKEATLESLDDIVRKAEGLGRELEEKMRR